MFSIANFPWMLPFLRFFNQQSSYGLNWRYMEATAKKLVSERRSRGNKGRVKSMWYHDYVLQLELSQMILACTQFSNYIIMSEINLLKQRKDMLEMILSAREDEEEFDKIPHHYNRNITKGLYDRDIVAHITHFFLAGK